MLKYILSIDYAFLCIVYVFLIYLYVFIMHYCVCFSTFSLLLLPPVCVSDVCAMYLNVFVMYTLHSSYAYVCTSNVCIIYF